MITISTIIGLLKDAKSALDARRQGKIVEFDRFVRPIFEATLQVHETYLKDFAAYAELVDVHDPPYHREHPLIRRLKHDNIVSDPYRQLVRAELGALVFHDSANDIGAEFCRAVQNYVSGGASVLARDITGNDDVRILQQSYRNGVLEDLLDRTSTRPADFGLEKDRSFARESIEWYQALLIKRFYAVRITYSRAKAV